jgi:hypothetical protein
MTNPEHVTYYEYKCDYCGKEHRDKGFLRYAEYSTGSTGERGGFIFCDMVCMIKHLKKEGDY